MDWRRAEDYAFTAELDAGGWAWQFLRRNPAYHQDYGWFIATWRALEADYGTPPARDFFRWKQDPRAWRAESEVAGCGTEICPGENDQVLIECWMGAKWGFRKFPVDPALDFPEALSWREQPQTVPRLPAGAAASASPSRVTLEFDLSRPLETQLEAARRQLAGTRHGLAQAGQLPPLSLRQGAPVWRTALRLLDGLTAGADLAELSAALCLDDIERSTSDARTLIEGGYLRILLLPD